MIVEIFSYAAIVALLAGLAATCVERLLAEMQRPRRLAWLGGYAAALAFPLLSPLWADSAPAGAANFGIATADTLSAYARVDWNVALLWLWAAVTTLLLVLYVAAWVRLKWIAGRWSSAHSNETSILVAEDVGPAVFGTLDPRVVLPRWLMDAPAPLRSTAVAHELEHIAAHDQAAIVAAQLIAILLPWNLPLSWFARRLRAAIENRLRRPRVAQGRGSRALRRRSTGRRPARSVIALRRRHADRARYAPRTEDTHHAHETPLFRHTCGGGDGLDRRSGSLCHADRSARRDGGTAGRRGRRASEA